MRAAIVGHVLDMNALIAEVARESNGATSVFIGTVRSSNGGRSVSGIEYSAYDEMAESEMMKILDEARARFEVAQAAVEHRTGKLAVGDASIAVAVASPHRQAALDAVRYIVDETKKRAPVWKLELYADGTREWVGVHEVTA
jgi:molybdopterin synthase catalytic subunit